MRLYTYILVCLLTFPSLSAKSQQDTVKLKQKSSNTQTVLQNLVKKVTQLKTGIVEDEIQGGIILDQTKTRNGKEFYDRFTQTFDIPDETFDYVIVIEEKPGMGTTTLISITVNDIEIYANYLQPRQDLLEESTNDAVTMATEFIKNYAQILLEMSSKEQTGTGIF